MERERLETDVVIVGAGPAGLAAAIRLRQCAPDLAVCVVEKGAQVGAHILSGAAIDPRALDELLPDWAETGAPLNTPVTDERLMWLSGSGAWRLPAGGASRGCRVASLGRLCQWLAERAEALGVEIFPGFAAVAPRLEDGRVAGVITGDMGRDRAGQPTERFQPGVDLVARQTLVAEGCRGSLARLLIGRFGLADAAAPQTHGLGIKELWQVAPERHRPGAVVHTLGWPLDGATHGGGFLYHLGDGTVSVGLVVALDHGNPALDPFVEMQRLKTHPLYRQVLAGGRRIGWGARALVEGGLQALPELVFPGGVLIGDAAGFLNVPRIKGVHGAMKSGMLAAEAVAEALAAGRDRAETYPAALRASWLWNELSRARNVRPGFRLGRVPGALHAALDQMVLRGRAPWTLGHRADHTAWQPVARPRPDLRPDGVLTFDRPSSVHLSGTVHDESQPVHLRINDSDDLVRTSYHRLGGPEARYCPAGVYEWGDGPELRIQAGNCVHCKTCDIVDPGQNIVWTPPQGGDGPNYQGM